MQNLEKFLEKFKYKSHSAKGATSESGLNTSLLL